MTVSLAHRIAVHLLALDGLLALFLGGLLGPIPTATVAAVIGAAWWRDRLGVTFEAPRLGQAVLVLAVVASTLDLAYLAESLLDGFVRLLLFLLLYRLVTRRSLRDARDVAFLSFFMLVAASAVAFDFPFLFVFLAFLVLGVWTFMLHHVLTEAERVSGPGSAPGRALPLGRGLLGLSLAASGSTVLITAAFFFIIPRVGQAALPLRARVGAMVSGFSERVELGAFGAIETDATVVMRVRFPEGPSAPVPLTALRWRGVAFDHFDGTAWKAERPRRSPLTAGRRGWFDVGRYRGAGPILTQEIYLEPIGTEAIFAASRPLGVRLSTETIVVDDMGGITAPASTARFRYFAYSELEPASPARGRLPAEPPLDAAARRRYLQLPPLSPRVAALAREASAGSRGPDDAAARLSGFLSREFRYTLALTRRTRLAPIEEFLFVTRAGNCEYFASALAVMLRSVGVPSRLVNGFQSGEWNPYGRYVMVRQRDAHSWVEAHVDGVGWLTFDPSPRGDPPPGPGGAGLYLDALRLRWYRYVVNWSVQDQVSLATTLGRTASTWRHALADRSGGGTPPWIAPLSVVLVAAGGATAILRRWGRGRRRASASVPGFYTRALRILSRRGFRPLSGETAREFLRRVGESAPACETALGCVTLAYERERFGSTPPSPAERAAVDHSLRVLAQGRRPG